MRLPYGGDDDPAWYVGAALDHPGVSWVVRQVLDRHDPTGPHPGLPVLETAVRITGEGTGLLFLLNHDARAAGIEACVSGVDLLGGARTERGTPLTVAGRQVLLIREDNE